MARSSRLLLAVLAAALPAIAAAEGLYLYAIPTAVGPRGVAAEGPLRIRAFVPDPPAVSAALPAATRSVAADHVELELAAYPELEPRAPEGYRVASFVVDFDEPEVKTLRAELVARYGASPSLDDLRRFTSESIPHKSLDRGWDLASRVARSGAGDCTEHAVLLTALARAVGRPARVIVGALIARVDGATLGLGHAWAEIYDGDRWVPVDATPIADEFEGLAYLPLVVLEDEGPGYALDLGRQMQHSWVRRIEVEGGTVSARRDAASR